MSVTRSHRLVLPADANHHGTLYAGSLLRMTLEAAYATACGHVGPRANIVLRRVLNLECLKPVPVGTVTEIQGIVLRRTQAYLVVGLVGTPLAPGQGPWLEGLLGFAQLDADGKPDAFPEEAAPVAVPDDEPWPRLARRMERLLRIR
jgi:acyl-CoA thioesterase YciA